MGSHTHWLRKIYKKNGVIVPECMSGNLVPVFRNGDRRSRPIAWLKQVDCRMYIADGKLVGTRGEYRVAPSFINRSVGSQAQHMDVVERDVYDPHGEKTRVRVNMNTSAFARICRLQDTGGERFLAADEIEAGHRFLNDYARSGMGRVQTQQFDNPRVDGQGLTNAAEMICIAAIDAKNRVADALQILGPGLDKAMLSICADNENLGAVEKEMGWARGSSKTVLKLALARLSDFYGCKPGRCGGEDTLKLRQHSSEFG